MTTYDIDRIADLLKVPIDRRAACLREIEYALALHELAFGEEAASVEIWPMRWTDDGNKTTIHDNNGKPFLTLEVLTQHNAWRRGAKDGQTDPVLLGKALDAAIAHIATIGDGPSDPAPTNSAEIGSESVVEPTAEHWLTAIVELYGAEADDLTMIEQRARELATTEAV